MHHRSPEYTTQVGSYGFVSPLHNQVPRTQSTIVNEGFTKVSDFSPKLDREKRAQPIEALSFNITTLTD